MDIWIDENLRMFHQIAQIYFYVYVCVCAIDFLSEGRRRGRGRLINDTVMVFAFK